MKKGLFIVLALAIAMASACHSASNENGNENSGNKNRNYSQDIYVDSRIVPVIISLDYKKNSDVFHFTVTPPTVTISGATQQIQWIISNDSDYDLTDIKIYNFKGQKTGNTDPFRNGGAFEFSSLTNRTVQSNQLSGAAAAYDTYEYEVAGTLTLSDGSKTTIKLDPKVVISGN